MKELIIYKCPISGTRKLLENGTDENGEPILLFREGKAYVDLSIQHTLSSPDTAYRIVHKAYDKILIDLAVDEYIHIVELRRTKKTKTEIVYEYCADHNNDWGEIHYTPGDIGHQPNAFLGMLIATMATAFGGCGRPAGKPNKHRSFDTNFGASLLPENPLMQGLSRVLAFFWDLLSRKTDPYFIFPRQG